MVKDIVCGMDVNEKRAKYKVEYMNKLYYFCSSACKTKFEKQPEKYVGEGKKMPEHKTEEYAEDELAKDPICGMVIPKKSAIKREAGGRTYYFCSEDCVKTFEAPEEMLKSMKRRVTIAISGVVILAILRAAFFLGLAAGATILT